MKFKLYNNTDTIITINDVGTYTLLPREYSEYSASDDDINQSDMVLEYIAKGLIIVNNYMKDMGASEGIKWLATQTETLPYSHDGKLSVHATSKYPGLYVYWAGRGDNFDNGYIGNGEPILLTHQVGQDKAQIKYIDFNCLGNKTQMHEGTVIWSNARMGDSGSCSLVTSVMPTEPGTNTNFNLYGGYLIVPAAGDGTLQVTGDMTNIDPALGCFVEMLPDEVGIKPPTFWNADYNSTTNKFENIEAAPYGDGQYNLFAVETYISRFVNHINFLGDGVITLQSDDSDDMPHGSRILHHINTSEIEGIEDHDWQFSVVLTLQRDRTY